MTAELVPIAEQTAEEAAAELAADEFREQVERERHHRAVRAAVEAENAPPLQWWSIDEFLAAPGPEPLIDGFLYRDSLACLFGAPGAGKTFVALDMAFRVASGRPWANRATEPGRVVYVMAEGQAVNRDRTRAWLDRHRVDQAALRGRFIAVPHAVLLTPYALGTFVESVAAFGPALVILDTKNAMQVGKEESASDWAVTRRALDLVRTASGAAVVLIDHTGYQEHDRPRGSSAQVAAYDTIVKVEQAGGRGAPATLTTTVTRDKAAEAGAAERFHLRMAPPAAVPVHAAGIGELSEPSASDWKMQPIPADLAHAQGPGAKAVPDLARFMSADLAGDRGEIGVTLVEARKAIGASEGTGRRAWSWLIKYGWIVPAESNRNAPTGRHVWSTKTSGRSS